MTPLTSSWRARTRADRRTRSTIAALCAGTLVVSSALLAGIVTPTAAAGLCATPGGGGAGGTLTGVVNTYYPGVGSVAAGATAISVGTPTGAATAIAAGDLLLVIQVQGADFDSTNTNSYGHGGAPVAPASGYTALNGSGAYEYVRATGPVSAGSVPVAGLGVGGGLLNSFISAAATSTSGVRTFQVVRVPQYTTATTSSTLTAAAWNGSTGGVLALDTSGTLTLGGTVSVDGLGFRGGIGIQRGGGAGASTDVVASSAAGNGGTKGEGIGGTPSQVTTSNGYPGGDVDRGAPANAGGGGTDGNPAANDQNTGGGGGGNGGAGGVGGNAWSSARATGGYGGVALPASASRIFLGGGGGAGTGNNFTAPNSSGAPGGGIIAIRAGAVAGSGTLSANGGAAFNTTQNDGGGGGGAGGSIILTSPSGSLAGATLRADGGRGGNAWPTQAGAGNAHGPGGGGGGGWILTSSAPTAQSVAAGANGITTTGNLVYGAAPGTVGQTATPAGIPGVSGGAECADLSLVKTAAAPSVTAGGSIVYSLSVSNAGPAAAAAVSVTDPLPAGTSFVSATGTGWTCTNNGSVSVTCTRPTVASGTTAPVITLTVLAPAQQTSLTNTATVSSTSPDPNPNNNSSSAPVQVVPSADLSIVKTGPGSVLASGAVAYSLAVSNAGPSDATALTVTDTLPAGVTFVSAAGTGWTCTQPGPGSVSCTRPSLATGSAAPVITVTVVAPPEGATLLNRAAVSSSTSDPDPTNNRSSVTTGVTASADLSLAKSGPATAVAGSSVSYTLTASSAGPSTAVGVTVVDSLPSGVTFVSADGTGWTCTHSGDISVSCTLGSLAAGATASPITVVVTAPAQATTLSNTADVASTTFDRDPTNNTARASTVVTASADLSLAKTGPASVVAGGSISYTLAVANAGPSDAVNLTVTDTLPGGVTFGSASGTGWTCTHAGNASVSCTRPLLAPGASGPPITVVVTAPAQATTLTNSAAVGSDTADPRPADNSDSATTDVVASADLSIVKSGPVTVNAAGAVSYTLAVANAGPSDAVDVTVTETLPAGVTFVAASGTGWSCANTGDTSVTCSRTALAAGATAPVITVDVTAPAQATSLTNSASVASTTADPDPSNNSSSVTTGVSALADLSIVKTGPATVTAGGSTTYSLVVANAGPSDAADLAVTDTLPAGVTFVSASGSGWACTSTGDTSVSCLLPTLATGATAPAISVVVTAPSEATTLTNTASVASTTADPDTTNNTDTATTDVSASADVSIVKTGPVRVVAGGTISYSLTVANAGPSSATDLTVSDVLPSGVTFVSAAGAGWTCTHVASTSVTCTLPTLAAKVSAAVITVVVTAPASATSLTNNASVASATADPDTTNNSDNATTAVTASANLAITKTGPAAVVAGGSITYSLKVSNAGPSSADALLVADTLPAGVTFVSAAGPGWTCTNVGSTSVSCTLPTLAAGATAAVITVVVTAPSGAASLSNTAAVTSATADPDLADNSSSAPTQVGASADLSVVKTGPATVLAGSSISYSLAVSNAGPDTALAVVLVDTLPAGVTFLSAAGTGWACVASGSATVTCTRPDLAIGATAPVVTLVVRAPAIGGLLVNHATVSSSTSDPVADNNASAAPAIVQAAPSGGGPGGGGGGPAGGGGGGGTGGTHPQTGADLSREAAWAFVFLLLGAFLVRPRRRARLG